MRTFCIIMILLCCSVVSSQSAADTLRDYTAESRFIHYRSDAIILQAARFSTPSPGYIERIVVAFGGPSDTGSARVRIFGHEGGLQTPLLQTELAPARIVRKSQYGMERIGISFPEPVRVANNQFFVVVDQIAPGVTLLSDSRTRSAECSSPLLGERWSQYLQTDDDQWRSGRHAYVIDVEITYDKNNGPIRFTDITGVSGIDTTLAAGSIAWSDINDDNYPDLLVDGKLYYNNGGSFTDGSEQAGLRGRPRSNTFIDLDGDGDVDIVFLGIRSAGNTESRAYENLGNGKFREHILALPQLDGLSCVSFADLNGDGYLDLFAGQATDVAGEPLPNYLLFNDTRFGFSDSSALLYTTGSDLACSRGSQWIDFDNDGDLDLYVANDFAAFDELWRNNGNGSFTNVIAESGIATFGDAAHQTTGCAWYDYDNDGNSDLLLPQFGGVDDERGQQRRGSAILRNLGAPEFRLVEQGASSGIAYEHYQAGGTWGDLNNDGLADFILTTPCACSYVEAYLQRPDHRFESITFPAGFHTVSGGEDAVWVDYDNDGKLDLAIGAQGAFRLYRNNSALSGNYIDIEVERAISQATAIGARVQIHTASGVRMQTVSAGRGRLMQDPPRLHFGLDRLETVDSVVVQWPDGSASEKFYPKRVNTTHRLVEGQAQSAPALQDMEHKAYPNPFTTSISIAYRLGAPARVHAAVYTLTGKRIHTLADEFQEAGTYTYDWNINTAGGPPLAPGVYMYRIEADEAAFWGAITLQE